MTFQEAFEQMKNGKNVRRKSAYIRLHPFHDIFTNHAHQKVEITPIDLISDDWEIVE